jgi:hypothetical protein
MNKIILSGIFFNKKSIEKMNNISLVVYLIWFIVCDVFFPVILYFFEKLVGEYGNLSYLEILKLSFVDIAKIIIVTMAIFLILSLMMKLVEKNADFYLVIKSCIAMNYVRPLLLVLILLTNVSLLNVLYYVYCIVFIRSFIVTNSKIKLKSITYLVIITFLIMMIILLIGIRFKFIY